jgi:hypothetical protein
MESTNIEAVPGERREFRGLIYQCIRPGDYYSGGIWKEIVHGQLSNHIPDYTICCQLDKFGITINSAQEQSPETAPRRLNIQQHERQ